MQTDCTKITQLLRTTLLNKHNIYTRKNTNTKPRNTKKHNTKQSQNEKNNTRTQNTTNTIENKDR